MLKKLCYIQDVTAGKQNQNTGYTVTEDNHRLASTPQVPSWWFSWTTSMVHILILFIFPNAGRDPVIPDFKEKILQRDEFQEVRGSFFFSC